MRVAIVTESFLPRTNGVSNSVLQVARRLASRGIEVMIMAPRSSGPESAEFQVHRVRSMEIPGVHDVDVALTRSAPLEEVLRRFDPTVIHLASPVALGLVAITASRALGVPTVAVFQTDIAGFARHYHLSAVSFLADRLVRHIHRAATLTLAPSSSSRLYLRDLGVERVRTWGRGVDMELFSRSARSEERHHELGYGRPVVGFVGRLAPEKRVDMLAGLSRREDLQVVIVGDGPSRHDLERAMPTAHFTGRLHRQELAQTMASMDVLVTPGELETFCQVIQEGMASGVPVVAPAVGGPRDLIMHRRTGLLYPPDDRAAMERHVLALLDDPAWARSVADTAQTWVSTRTWDSVVDELIGHYEDVSLMQRMEAA